MRFPVFAGLLALSATPLVAQSNAERVTNDRYTRSHDYDLLHQVIEVKNFNWDSLSFDGQVTTTLVALRPGLDSVILDSGHLLKVKTVTGPRSATLRFANHGDTLVVFPAHAAAFHDTVTFTIAYAGKVENGQGLTFINTDGRDHRPPQIWSQGEDMDNHYWFPTYDFPNDKMTWDLAVTLPRQFTGVSNGALVSDLPATGATHTTRWRQSTPSATYLVSLIVAPLVKIHDTWHTVPVDYYVYRADSARAWRLFHQTVDEIDTYSRLTGVPYPWAKYAQTTVADFFGGMENVSATTLVDWLPDNRAYQDRPWFQWILIPHELAHQWFGDYVTTVNWANTWLNEGFAEFMPGQYWQAKLGEHVAEDYYLDEYRQFVQIDHFRRMPLAAEGSNNIYPRGALVLRMLEHQLGPQRFWAGIHRYLADHAHGNATTDDLRQAFLDATGQNLDRFFDEWIYQAGYPEFTVAANYDAAAHTVQLSVKQTQADTLTKADSSGFRFTTPLVYHMPVTVTVGQPSGQTSGTFDLNAREQTLTVANVAQAPTYVIFDDGNRILKTLDFSQATPWLAAQLARDPDLWNRQWVIGQLASRATDSLAGKALATAATGADYFFTRIDAIGALAKFSPDVALPPLERALADTSAQVRQAAVRALGGLGGDRAVTLLEATLKRDSSYAVRGSVVGALAAAKAPSADAAIRANLRAPSYRDQVQNGALVAIAQTADTAMIASVDSLVGMNQQALGTLAGLGQRGSARALDVMASHLNDERQYVRRWTVGVFRQMRPDVALPKLEAMQASITHDDTRTAVRQAIEALRARAAR
ncbi:MAG TPA: DUF3458 domain-containing protein [Gemmatimonadales bacterium]